MASSSTILTDEGGSFIAASQRADGTWRKPRRVKDGYTPQDEVPLYESRGKQFSKHQPQYPVGLDPAIIRAAEARKDRELSGPQAKKSPIPGLVIDDAKTKKKAKKKSVDEINEGLSKIKLNQKEQCPQVKSEPKVSQNETTSKGKSKKAAVTMTESSPADPAKRIKNLNKRLREIEAIELKITSGELKALEKDQVEKVSRKKEILSEIKLLESLLEV